MNVAMHPSWDDGDRFWSGEGPIDVELVFDTRALLATSAAAPLLRVGDHGPAVVAWQRILRALGFAPGLPDGLFGLRTRTATVALQHASGVPGDGIVGPDTRAAADRLAAGRREVQRRRTPLSEEQLADVLRVGHVGLWDELPSVERLGCAWAQVAFEHGRGMAIWNYNIGNITAFSWPSSYYEQTVRERVSKDPDVWKTVTLRFRAHATITDGVKDYWRLLSGDRYSTVLPFFDHGDPDGAARELARCGYYTDYPDHYAAQMSSLYRHFMRVLAHS